MHNILCKLINIGFNYLQYFLFVLMFVITNMLNSTQRKKGYT